MNRILFFVLTFLSGLCSCNNNSAIHQCSYVYTEVNENLCDDISKKEFTTPVDAEKAINDILDALGIPKANFILVQCDNIQNCMATIDGNKRYIIYDNSFIEQINNKSRTNWSSVSIMAHEIGHHLNGHFLNINDNDLKKRREEELDADFTSGFVMAKLGATLKQAQSAMLTLLDNDCDEAILSTHPCRKKRLEAIENGWNKAFIQLKKPPIANTSSIKIFPNNYPVPNEINDVGISNLPRFSVDINHDGIIDYGRFVGNYPNISLSFQIGDNKGGFSKNAYGYNSYNKIDKGILSRPIWLEDVNHDGYLDYCRYVGNFPGIFRAALLGTSTGFDGEHYYKF
jgi:hypothetical protein